MSENLELFKPEQKKRTLSQQAPLAEKLRPQRWEEFAGIEHFDPNLVEQLKSGRGRIPSLILWGPPGCGKTTFARLVGNSFSCNFVEFSAVLGGVKEVREIISKARALTIPTLLFVDEIHRFNKSQQDAFLPHVENGTIALIGATTANPSFYLNGALLSRAHTVKFEPLSEADLGGVVARALEGFDQSFDEDAVSRLISASGGDVRKLLNFLETVAASRARETTITLDDVEQFIASSPTLFYDRDGEEHYNMASAFIKSMRGSDPDAALYWALRMVESGEDPAFVIRRMIIFASEDIGNADPRALQLAVATAEAYERVGLPEGRIPLSHCVTYLASAPKSNRSYKAMHAALEAVKARPKAAVPMHLRNAPTKMMKDFGYGQGYEYPHARSDGFAPGVEYLPEEESGQVFYVPSEHGLESKIKQRLTSLRPKRYGAQQSSASDPEGDSSE